MSSSFAPPAKSMQVSPTPTNAQSAAAAASEIALRKVPHSAPTTPRTSPPRRWSAGHMVMHPEFRAELASGWHQQVVSPHEEDAAKPTPLLPKTDGPTHRPIVDVGSWMSDAPLDSALTSPPAWCAPRHVPPPRTLGMPPKPPLPRHAIATTSTVTPSPRVSLRFDRSGQHVVSFRSDCEGIDGEGDDPTWPSAQSSTRRDDGTAGLIFLPSQTSSIISSTSLPSNFAAPGVRNANPSPRAGVHAPLLYFPGVGETTMEAIARTANDKPLSPGEAAGADPLLSEAVHHARLSEALHHARLDLDAETFSSPSGGGEPSLPASTPRHAAPSIGDPPLRLPPPPVACDSPRSAACDSDDEDGAFGFVKLHPSKPPSTEEITPTGASDKLTSLFPVDNLLSSPAGAGEAPGRPPPLPTGMTSASAPGSGSSNPRRFMTSMEHCNSRRFSTMEGHLRGSDNGSSDASGDELEDTPARAMLSRDHSDDDCDKPESAAVAVRRKSVANFDDHGNPDSVDNIVFLTLLGRGACGTVWHCLDEKADEERAVKVLPRKHAGRFASIDEVEAMKKLVHKHIVRLYECIDDPTLDHVYLVLQYANGGSASTMRDDGTCEHVPVRDVADLVQGVAAALLHCHRLGVIHGDIKPDNILVHRTPDAKPNALLSDFGVSIATYSKRKVAAQDSVCVETVMDFLKRCGELEATTADGTSTLDSDQMAANFGATAGAARTLGGTPAFLAPEVLLGGERTPASDMWALGVTIYALLFGRLPFEGCTARSTLPHLKRAVCETEPVFPLEATTRGVLRRWKTLIMQLLQKDPEHRLTAVQLTRCKLLYPSLFAIAAACDEFDGNSSSRRSSLTAPLDQSRSLSDPRPPSFDGLMRFAPSRQVAFTTSTNHDARTSSVVLAGSSADLFFGEKSMENIAHVQHH